MDTNEIRFEKVSFEEFNRTAYLGSRLPPPPEEEVYRIWEGIKLPQRATAGSAGYDFFLPHGIELQPGYPVVFATGIRCIMPKGIFLALFARSGLGFKYGVRLRNGTGIIDSDYCLAPNEGHIRASLTTEEPIELEAGAKFMQGIFLPYTLVNSDTADGIRTGGFGSTGV